MTLPRWFHQTMVPTAAISAAAWIALATTIAQAQSNPLKIVVTIKPVHALALQVLEGVAEPSLVVDGAASPHTYALKPSDAKTFNEADIVIRVSEALEPFTARVVKSLPASVQVITLDKAAGVKTLPRRLGATFEKHETGGKGHAGHSHGPARKDAIDGHLWLDPANAKAFISEIARAVAAKRPEAATRLEGNAVKARARIDLLDADLTKALAPAARKPYVVFHDAFQYLEVRYDLKPIGSITVDPEVPPSAKRLADLRKKIVGLGAICVFAEPSYGKQLITSITEGTSARSGILDPEALGIPRGPDAYDALMRGLAKDMQACLAASP